MPSRSQRTPPSVGRRAPRDASGEGCAVTELFHTLSKAHMLDILQIFTQDSGPHRFVDIQERLSLSPNTLSERLKDLVRSGLLTRTVYNEIPPRVDYAATPKARDLAPVFESLQAWAARNDLRPQASEAHAVA